MQSSMYAPKKLGMPVTQAIVFVTPSAGDLLDMRAQLGSFSIGKYADVVAVKGNPVEDITPLKNIGFVTKAGKIIKAEKS